MRGRCAFRNEGIIRFILYPTTLRFTKTYLIAPLTIAQSFPFFFLSTEIRQHKSLIRRVSSQPSESMKFIVMSYEIHTYLFARPFLLSRDSRVRQERFCWRRWGCSSFAHAVSSPYAAYPQSRHRLLRRKRMC